MCEMQKKKTTILHQPICTEMFNAALKQQKNQCFPVVSQMRGSVSGIIVTQTDTKHECGRGCVKSAQSFIWTKRSLWKLVENKLEAWKELQVLGRQ